jgi:hypothetical protein
MECPIGGPRCFEGCAKGNLALNPTAIYSFCASPIIQQANIEHTRFPVPEDEQHSTADYPGLLRAADLIGQLADVNYLRKIPALFAEFEALARLQKQDEEFCRRLRAAIETGRECCPTAVFTEPCTNRPVSNYMRPD